MYKLKQYFVFPCLLQEEKFYFSVLFVLYVEVFSWKKKKSNVEGWEFHPIELLIYRSFTAHFP